MHFFTNCPLKSIPDNKKCYLSKYQAGYQLTFVRVPLLAEDPAAEGLVLALSAEGALVSSQGRDVVHTLDGGGRYSGELLTSRDLAFVSEVAKSPFPCSGFSRFNGNNLVHESTDSRGPRIQARCLHSPHRSKATLGAPDWGRGGSSMPSERG